VVTVSIKQKSYEDFTKALKRFAKKSKQTLRDATLEQAALACQDAATFTPPLVKGGGKGLSKAAELAGEGAVAGDIKKIFVAANDRQSRNAANVLAMNMAYATRNNDVAMFDKLIRSGSMKALKGLSPIMQKIANDMDYERAFKKAKNYLNRTQIVLSDYGTIGFVFNLRPVHDEIKAKYGGRFGKKVKPVKKKLLVETQAEIKEYIRERQMKVGRIKSGWAMALRSLPKPMINGVEKNFGTDLLQTPWIVRHTSVDGRNSHSFSDKFAQVTVTNSLGNINGIADQANVLGLVLGNRVKQMRRRVSHLVKDDVDDFNNTK
jgi:hypothetical protein